MPSTTLNETDLVELLYQGKSGPLTINSDVLGNYVIGCKELGQQEVFTASNLPETIEEAVKQWNLPEDILSLDLDIYFAEKISTYKEAIRVAEELELFRSHGLETMLRFMIYLVRVMKEHNIVWGVGRGSSVSSFLLYLVGLHQVNSVKYNLDIKEFIR